MRLSKGLDKYTVNSIHVKAARILKQKKGITLGAGDDVVYVKTRTEGGVLPIECCRGGEIDLDAYRDSIASVVDPITSILGIDFKKGKQHGLEAFL
jgi:DNA polymerase elongation subunit (family B)